MQSNKEIRLINTNFGDKDLHIILTYKNAVEPGTVNKDIINYLSKIKTETNDFEYCYKMNQITDKHPAIHILLRTEQEIDHEKLKSLWNKGIAKATLIENLDRRAVNYYFNTERNGKIHCSGGLKSEYIS